MANTLTNLIPTMYEALNVVSRERIGFIPAVSKNSSAERAALSQSIRVPIAPAGTAEADNTPAVTAPDTGDETIDSVEITISKTKHYPVRFTGEEIRGLMNAGSYQDIARQRFENAFRRLANLIEIDLASCYKYASRGVGTPGTTPFNTANTVTDFANVARVLDDNGCPNDGTWRLVLSNAAVQNLRGKQSNFFKVNEAGSADLLRDGILDRAFGFNIGQSHQVATHTAGTQTSGTLTTADYAVGATTLTLASAGSGTIVEGDMVNIAGENNGIYYGVRTGDAEVSNGGTFVLNNPGLTIAQTTNSSAITTATTGWKANLAFHPTAIQLVTRVPDDGMDMATDATLVTDPVSGLTFEIAEYKQFMRTVFHVRIAWGWQAIKQEHIAVLFG